jgi:hypothetical protein
MKGKSVNWFKVRIIFLSCLLFFCFVLVVGRMFQLQVLKKEQLYKLAAQQQHTQIPLVPKRGTIYDSRGNELAVSIEVDSVYADARKVTEVEKTARALAAILEIDREELKRRLKSHRSFEWVQRKISPKEVEQVKELRLPGIAFLKENRRFYPNSQLAAHLVGFVGLDSKGLEGIEFQYDALLTGENQVWSTARDALGREIAMGRTSFAKEDHYRNIFLTIDKPIQHITETELGRGVEKWGQKEGWPLRWIPGAERSWPWRPFRPSTQINLSNTGRRAGEIGLSPMPLNPVLCSRPFSLPRPWRSRWFAHRILSFAKTVPIRFMTERSTTTPSTGTSPFNRLSKSPVTSEHRRWVKRWGRTVFTGIFLLSGLGKRRGSVSREKGKESFTTRDIGLRLLWTRFPSVKGFL